MDWLAITRRACVQNPIDKEAPIVTYEANLYRINFALETILLLRTLRREVLGYSIGRLPPVVATQEVTVISVSHATRDQFSRA